MTLKVAVIGVGAMGRNHARIFSEMPNVELVGVADADVNAGESVAKRYGSRAYTDFVQLLEKEQPDVVTIAVPTIDHLGVALNVIKHKIHLMIEKPIAFSVEDGKQIIAAAEQAGVKLMIGHVERFNPAVIALKTKIEAGELGSVFQLDAHRQGPFPKRVVDVGVVIDLAVHDLDVIRYVCGADVTRVYAETDRRIHSTREDMLIGLIRLSNGAVGTLTINWLTPTKIRELYVTGERGMFRVDYLTQDLYFYENASTNGDDWESLQVLRGVSEGRMIRHVVVKKEPLRSELEAFLASVTEDAPIAVTGQDGLWTLELAQALIQSGTEHRAIDGFIAIDNMQHMVRIG
jgi:UDP-N-acetylglucosamine 3-dehydrogenase